MKPFIIIIVLIVGGHQAWQRFAMDNESTTVEINTGPLFDEPYVAIYGRDSCGYTQRLIEDLEASNVSFHYYVVDKKPIADRLHATMADQGMQVQRYNLPVVDVNGALTIRPGVVDVKVRLSRGI